MSDKSRIFNGFLANFDPIPKANYAKVTFVLLPEDEDQAKNISAIPLGIKLRTITVRVSYSRTPELYVNLSDFVHHGIFKIGTEVIRNVEYVTYSRQLSVVNA